MQNFKESSVRSTLLSVQCLCSDGRHAPDISPEEARYVRVPCYNPGGENLVTCQDSRIGFFLKEAGGLALDVVFKSQVTIPLDHIPIFDHGTLHLAAQCDAPVIGLTVNSILKSAVGRKAGRLIPKPIQFKPTEAIRKITQNKKVILFMTGKDTLIEWLWSQRNNVELYQTIQAMGFWAVTGFNFSVYGGECPFGQALNQKRSLISAKIAEDNGVLAIPHIYAVTKYHIDRFRNWLAKNPKQTLVTINCQCQRTEKNIAHLVHMITSLMSANPQLHFLLQGFHFSELYRFGHFLNRIHFADAKPLKYMQSYRILGEKTAKYSKEEYEKRKSRKSEIAIDNIRFRNEELSHLRGLYSKASQAG